MLAEELLEAIRSNDPEAKEMLAYILKQAKAGDEGFREVLLEMDRLAGVDRGSGVPWDQVK